ncbi:hypothetical protein P5673_004570 [Acropora cervicornis]|uniref:Uncharacterized protein n=1 Tax=Acropora cervicornis TaxID=6130 RepID=A0AAD9VEF3_ACRCE|nr:hypothetical protein P5673_004570 [Acropora cervicornis]
MCLWLMSGVRKRL